MKNSLKEAFSLINKYSKKSIFYEYLKKLTLLISLPLLIIITIIFYYNQLIVQSEMQYAISKSLDSAYIFSNTMFDEISTNYLIYNEQNSVKLFLNTERENFIAYSALFSDNILDRMSSTVQTSNYLNAISIYSFSGKYIMSTNGGNYIEEFYKTGWLEYYEKTGQTNFIISSDKEKTLYIAFGCYYNNTLNGIIVFDVPYSKLTTMLLGNTDSERNNFCFLQNDGKIIYATSPKLYDMTIPDGVFEENFNYKKDGKLFSAKRIESQSNITLLYINDSEEINDMINHTNMLFIICVIIAILSPLFIALYVSFKFYKSVTEIISVLNVSNSESADEVNEFSFISNHIADLIDKHSSVEAELVQKASMFKQAQSVALQTQLSPHFLFNTLNLIGLTSRVMFKGANKIDTIVSLLGELLTAALDTKNYILTVEEEIDYAKKYIEIQQIRYKNNFEINWDIDESVLQVKTVKLILQPLIENSFFHGFSTLEDEKGILTISAKSENDSDMYLCVSDNGEKISDEKLEEIREQLKINDMPHKEHIGLCNVNTRIKLVFGEKYGVKIYSDHNGTSVYIHIPKV